MNIEEIKNTLDAMGERALEASRVLAVTSSAVKNDCLNHMAKELERRKDAILEANAKDMAAGREHGLSDAMLDRLRLDDKRVVAMADGLRQVASQSDPVGQLLSTTVRPNGLRIDKVSVPIGVIGIIYESRPNVTVDAAGICLKAGNSVLLRGGSEAFHSNMELARILSEAAMACKLPGALVQLLPWTSREAVKLMLKMNQCIDLIIPRGGEGLIRAVVAESTIPVIKHYKGVCHIFVNRDANFDKSIEIVINAKCQRPSACNALENLLVHRSIAKEFLPKLAKEMIERNVTLRGDSEVTSLIPEAELIADSDYTTEYLDYIMAVKIVGDVREAVDFINAHGSRHSDAILSGVEQDVNYFTANVDSSCVYVNASTRFTDGGEFGMGAEIGISTDKLHARGPMGANELTSYKYIIRGAGQVRE